MRMLFLFAFCQPQSLIDELLLYKRSEDQIELKEKQLSTMRVDVCSTETLKCLKGKETPKGTKGVVGALQFCQGGKCQNFRLGLRTSNQEPKILVSLNFRGNSQVQSSDQANDWLETNTLPATRPRPCQVPVDDQGSPWLTLGMCSSAVPVSQVLPLRPRLCGLACGSSFPWCSSPCR